MDIETLILAPVLIAGWGTGHPMGVAGAGLASSIALAVGFVMLAFYFQRLEKFVGFDRAQVSPQLIVSRRLLKVGLPAGGEFILLFVLMAVLYWVLRPFGPDAQAGFGVGIRIMQSMFLPAMAVAFAAAPIVGQNFAAGKFLRVRETFALATLIGGCIMVALTLFCQWGSAPVIRAFTKDPTAIAVGSEYLQVILLEFFSHRSLYLPCSAVFQGLGNAMLAMISSAVGRLISFVRCRCCGFPGSPISPMIQLWYLSVASVALQAVFSLWLVRRSSGCVWFRRRKPIAAQT